MAWHNRAACLDGGPELFFLMGDTGAALVQIEEAKAVGVPGDVVEAGQCAVPGNALIRGKSRRAGWLW
jgi:hypothetical protein